MPGGLCFKTIASVLLIVSWFSAGVANCQQTEEKTDATAIEALVDQLRLYPWEGPRNFTSPLHWFFEFTESMQKVLNAGPSAENVLLRHLADDGTKDQIIILLGGVGGVKSIEPIIDAMADEQEQKTSPEAKKRNLVANIALTNITAAEVIWHRGGGIPFAKCPDNPKVCWSDWWTQSKDYIEKEIDVSRNYVNYPNYGIYKQRKHENTATHADHR